MDDLGKQKGKKRSMKSCCGLDERDEVAWMLDGERARVESRDGTLMT